MPAPPTCFQALLVDQTARLTQVVDRSTLAEWHANFAQAWSADAAELAADANRLLGLSDETAIQPDLGYLAVERAGARPGPTWILLSANPGWNDVTSMKERAEKGDLDAFDAAAYHTFRTAFFPLWWDRVMLGHRPRGAGWWDRALSFVHEVADHPRPAGRMALHPDLDVIGWELWPFHSKRDGLTGAMKRSPELKAFARASLAAALRMPQARVIVASVAGYELLTAVLPKASMELGAAYVSDLNATGTPTDITVVKVLRSRDGRVVGVRRQLFSAWGNVARPLRAQIVAIARGAQAVPSIAQADAAQESAALHVATPVIAMVVPVAQTTQPELKLSPESADGGLVMLVPVRDVNGLEDLDPNADDATLQERIGGYWRTSMATDGRLAKVRAALEAGQPVWLVAYKDCRVVRVMRVEAGALDDMPSRFSYPEAGREVPFEHSDDARANLIGNQLTFARLYVGTRTDRNGSTWTEYRVRYRVAFVEDADLCGRLLSADEPISWQTPLLYRLPATSAPTTPSTPTEA